MTTTMPGSLELDDNDWELSEIEDRQERRKWAWDWEEVVNLGFLVLKILKTNK